MVSDLTVPTESARRVAIAQAVLSLAVVAVVLAVPLPGTVLRIVVGVLVVAMILVQFRTSWSWRRQGRVVPKLPRWANMTLWFWGSFTGVMFVLYGDSSLRAVLGTLIAAAIFGLVMWFVDRQPQDRVNEQV